MTTSLVRKQLETTASTPAAPGSPDAEVVPAAAPVVPIASEPARRSLHLLLAGLRRRVRGTARAESAESDSIVALVEEQAQSRADAHYRNDEGGADDDGGWG